jgi:hypothetical protein
MLQGPSSMTVLHFLDHSKDFVQVKTLCSILQYAGFLWLGIATTSSPNTKTGGDAIVSQP